MTRGQALYPQKISQKFFLLTKNFQENWQNCQSIAKNALKLALLQQNIYIFLCLTKTAYNFALIYTKHQQNYITIGCTVVSFPISGGLLSCQFDD